MMKNRKTLKEEEDDENIVLFAFRNKSPIKINQLIVFFFVDSFMNSLPSYS